MIAVLRSFVRGNGSILYNIIIMFFWRLDLMVIKSAIRVIVNLKVILTTCGSLVSTVSDSKNDDAAFLDPSLVGSL